MLNIPSPILFQRIEGLHFALNQINSESVTTLLRKFPAYREYLTSPSAKRLQSFSAGRLCAHETLSRLISHEFAVNTVIKKAPTGEPLWPDELVGSISHSHHLACATVGSAKQFKGLGIDLECLHRFPNTASFKTTLLTPHELATASVMGSSTYLAIAFSAKESFYKCIFPSYQRFIGFQNIEVEIEPVDSLQGRLTFTPADRTIIAECEVQGCYEIRDDVVFTIAIAKARI